MRRTPNAARIEAHTAGLRTGLTLSAVIAGLLLPSVIWIFKDQIVWPWDQAWYAEVALQLAHAAQEGPLAWLNAMLSVVTSKPPLLQWSSQVTTLFVGLLGSYERGFLLVNVAANAATLALVFSTVLRLGGSPAAGIAAVLACGGASLFIGMTHQFVVEPMQSLTIAGLMRLSLEAGHLPAVRLAAALAICLALAFLAKTTSVGFTAPFLLYIVLARLGAVRRASPILRRGDLTLVGVAALLSAATIAWYAVNWPSVVAHIRNATMTEVALHYGSLGTLGTKLHFWGSALLQALTPWTFLGYATALTIAAALGVAAMRTLRQPVPTCLAEAVASGMLFAFCLTGTVAAGMLAYASQINEETRFLTPIIPLVAVLAGWSLSVLRREWLTVAAVLLFIANALAGHLHAHGVISLAPLNSAWLKRYRAETSSIERFERAVRLSCDPKRPMRYTIVGVEMPDFNANSAAFFAEKQKDELGYRCLYTSLGYAESDVEQALKRLYELINADYFVTLPSERIPNDPKDVLNKVSKAVAERIAASPDWERITDPTEPAQVFRRRR